MRSLLFLCVLSLSAHASIALNRPPFWNPMPPPQPERGQIKVAFWNIQSESVSDRPESLARYPQYSWTKRGKPVCQLIEQDAPHLLALCEYNLKQGKELATFFEKLGYRLSGFSAETLLSFEEIVASRRAKKEAFYGEFVGFLFDERRLELLSLIPSPLPRGEKHARILVEGRFRDRITRVEFVVLASHFDHRSASSREESAQIELSRIEELEREKIPWISVGDRNWYPDETGEKSAQAYHARPYICDFRDETLLGHFGPSGTFPGHLGQRKSQKRPVIRLDSGLDMVSAATVDVGFRSKEQVTAITSYAYTGEFSPETYDLLPFNQSGNPAERNFASDHYYIGGIFEFVKRGY